jgi:anti-anti-sigma regulatory factor
MTTKALYAIDGDRCLLRLLGQIRFTECPPIDRFVKDKLQEGLQFVVDLRETTLLDSTALGLLAQLAIHAREHQWPKPELWIANDQMRTLLESVCFDRVFGLVEAPMQSFPGREQAIEDAPSDAEELARQVASAHQDLIRLSLENKVAFQSVLDALTAQSPG